MSSSPSKPFRAFIKENLQRYDIVDHNLVGDMVFNLSNEVNKDLLLADVIGRVFKGFTPSDGGSLNSVAVTEGVAVSADGQLFVLPSGGSPSASIPSVSSSVYGVYATVVEQEAPSGEYENRRKWLPASGSPASETSVSVPVKKYKAVQLNVTDRLPWTSPAAIDINALFSGVVDAGGIQIAAVANNSSGQKALIDCRKMFASSGNIVTGVTVGGTSISVTGLAAESHTFPSTGDTKTQGIFGVRSFLGALADRVKAITGKADWWTTPATNLEQLFQLVGSSSGSGVNRIATISGTDASFDALTPADNDVVYDQQRDCLWRYSSSSTAAVIVNKVYTSNAGVSGRWLVHTRGLRGVANGLAELNSSAELDGSVLKALSVVGAAIANATITGAKLVNSTITSGKIASQTILADNIAARTIDLTRMDDTFQFSLPLTGVIVATYTPTSTTDYSLNWSFNFLYPNYLINHFGDGALEITKVVGLVSGANHVLGLRVAWNKAPTAGTAGIPSVRSVLAGPVVSFVKNYIGSTYTSDFSNLVSTCWVSPDYDGATNFFADQYGVKLSTWQPDYSLGCRIVFSNALGLQPVELEDTGKYVIPVTLIRGQ